MKVSKFFLVLIFLTLCLTRSVFADLVIEQECKTTNRAESWLGSPEETVVDYVRRVLIKDNILAIQLMINDVATREYGFDFDNQIYFESDLINNDYRKFLFSDIKKEYAKNKTRDLAMQGGPHNGLLRSVQMGDYKISSSRSIFRKKDINGLKCVLYAYKIGPGFFRLQPLSWGKKIKAWVTKDIPSYGIYEGVAAKLKEQASFYRSKKNEISDFIIILMESDGFPVEISSSSAYDQGMGRLYSKEKVLSTRFITRNISDTEISYFSKYFTLNPFEKGEISPPPQMALHNMMQRNMMNRQPRSFFFKDGVSSSGTEYRVGVLGMIYHILIPLVVILGVIFFAYNSVTRATTAYSMSPLLFDIYLIFVFLAVLMFIHLFVPYFKSIAVEFSILLPIGLLMAISKHYFSVKMNRKAAIDSGTSKICPHCKAVIDKIFAICPKCNNKV